MKSQAEQARFKVMIGQLTGILISRRRQRDVFGPAVMMLVMGLVLFLGAVFGPEMDHTIAVLLALTLSGWAAYRFWQLYRAESSHSRFHLLLGAGTLLLVLGAVALLLGVHLQLLWAGLLVLVSLAFLSGR